ncbi:serine hydrolase FSH [Annulohypoxylon truncatum]|uniref:serine hydrolase FSH n=1 Tax=Annulohypoxylon truncatum TaxID=327061 RepID=UPI0020076F7A|nr:serine hydrolase FSH [Annulohypoxylon truncatum]KAI1214241.1 serine hydrolase FSH [Annulohypoxylon truncatum]
MKILCLHGDGENENIFKSNLDSLLKRLQHSNTELLFDFANGPLQCPDLLAKDSQSPQPPHFKFYDKEEAEDIRKAGEWLATKLDSDGPYDGLIAFSQGVTVVSGFLLYRQWYDPELSPAFKFAIFISGSISLKVLKDIGAPVSKEAETAITQAVLQRDQVLGPLSAHVTKARRAVFNSDDCFGLNLNRLPLELKIRIPTVHIWGEKDPLFPSSIHLAGLCDPYIRKIYTHSGGHEIPQEENELMQITPLIEWCIHRGSWPGQTQL